jgi:hypothetical protein
LLCVTVAGCTPLKDTDVVVEFLNEAERHLGLRRDRAGEFGWFRASIRDLWAGNRERLAGSRGRR